MHPSTTPNLELFSVFPDVPTPRPASPDWDGSMPVRAVQLCAPITAASGYGFYIYSPTDFALRWDGEITEMSLLDGNELGTWTPLSGNVFPDVPGGQASLAALPAARREVLESDEDSVMTLINADPRQPDRFEMHPGLIARTAPGWSLLVRSAPNRRPIPGLRLVEGVLETSWFRDLVPVVGQLTDVGRVVRIYRNQPLACLQPVPDFAYSPDVMKDLTHVAEFARMPESAWEEFLAYRARRVDAPPGSYRSESRRRARAGGCPVAHD